MEKSGIASSSDIQMDDTVGGYRPIEVAPSISPAKPKVVSLFAGIGGFDLAFESAGASIVMQCEKDSFCQSILRKHWPSTPLHEDIRTLAPSEIPEADIWTAGFPCQDVSLARGSHGRSGLKGQHTSLFFDLIKLASKKKPKVILLENVVGLLNSHRGADFAIVISELAKIGYAVSWRVLNARYFGAPQSRSRVFISAWRQDFQRSLASIFEDAPGHVPEPARKGFITPDIHQPTGAYVPHVAYCVAATSGRHTGNDWARSYISYKGEVRRPTPTESERLQGFSADWSLPSGVQDGNERSYDAERYKAVGNAVAVPVVTWIAKRILAEMSSVREPAKSFRSSVPLVAPDLGAAANVTELKGIIDHLDDEGTTYRWKTGGCLWRGKALEASVPPAPSEVITSRFVDVLDPAKPDRRYFLTRNAAEGILRRAEQVGRSLFEPMHLALQELVS